MDFEPNEEQLLILAQFRRFLDREVKPAVDEHRNTLLPDKLMHELFAKLSQFGFGSFWLPTAAGGAGIDLPTSGLLYEELATVSPDMAGAIGVSDGAALALQQAATPEVRERFLPGVRAGSLIPCIAVTEPDTGSNVAAIRTRAVRDGDHYVISGEKTWISNGSVSDFALVVARLEVDQLAMFLVERESGYQAREFDKLGVKSWPTSQLFFDRVRVPASHMIGEPGAGLKMTLRLFERARCLVALYAVGIARAALEASIKYARERVQWGKPIGGHQLIQAMIAEMATDIDCARLLALRGLSLVEKGKRCDTQTSMAKWYATEAAVRITSKAVQIHGSYGLSAEFPVERMFRDARMLTIPDGTTQLQQLIIGRNLIGIDAFG